MGLLSFLFGSKGQDRSGEQELGNGAEASKKFRAGQVWGVKMPPGQPDAKLTVLQVEDGGKLGTIVHVALSGLAGVGAVSLIAHLPFAEDAVERSVTELERESGPVPDFAEGYGMWREAFERGKAGAFSITVAEAYEGIVQGMRDRQ